MATKNGSSVNISIEKNQIQKFLSEHSVFGNILRNIGRIPFEQLKKEEFFLANREEELRDKKSDDYKNPHVTTEEKYYYISRNLGIIARECNSNIAVMKGSAYFYTGKKWEKIPDKYVEEFMVLVASKSGLLVSEVSTKRAKEALYEQLLSDHHILENPTPDYVKINLQNGTLEYVGEKFELRKHSAEDMFCYALNFDYDPSATCARFDQFLDEVLPEKAAQDVLMEFIGYCFIPTKKLKLEMCLLLYGTGANGKGIIYELTKELLGHEHVSGYSMSALSYDANTRAQIADALVNYSSELGGRCNGDVLKKLISGEGVEVKNLYKDVYTLNDYQCKFMFNCNKLPQGTDIDQALARRLGIIEFGVVIPPEKRDVHLAEKLKGELPGIFNRVLAGANRLLINGRFTHSPMMDKTNQSFREKSDTVLQFINSEGWKPSCDINQSERLSHNIPHVRLNDLFDQYLSYCKEVNTTATNRKTFAERIRHYFYVQTGCTRNETWVFASKENEKSTDCKAMINDKDDNIGSVIDQATKDLNNNLK